MAKYTPDIAARAKKILTTLRERLPGAVEIVYDNYNALAIGFGPTERSSDAIFSIALYPRWVTLFFLKGVSLPDPSRILKGAGAKVRHVILDSASDLDRPDIRALMEIAAKRAEPRIEAGAKRRTVIKSVSEKQRPRRPQLKVSTRSPRRAK